MTETASWATHDFKAAQGSLFRRFLKFWEDAAKTVPRDNTGCEFDMHVREGVADSGAATLAHLSTRTGSDETQRIFFIGETSDGLPDADGVPDPSNGWIMLLLSAAETRDIAPSKAIKPKQFPFESTFYYDIELTEPGGDPDRILAGEFVLSHEVTRR